MSENPKTETEALTAEERAAVHNHDSPYRETETAKLLRLYDAALARAEAAEQKCERLIDEYFGGRTFDYEASERRALAAESRLAAATDCIKETLAGLDGLRKMFGDLECDPVDSDLVSADIDDASCPLRIFLSATPAPAAPCDAKQCDECGVTTPFDAPGFNHAQTCSEVGGPAPAATAEPACPRCDDPPHEGSCVPCHDLPEPTLIERIEAELESQCSPEDRLRNIRARIRASKQGGAQ